MKKINNFRLISAPFTLQSLSVPHPPLPLAQQLPRHAVTLAAAVEGRTCSFSMYKLLIVHLWVYGSLSNRWPCCGSSSHQLLAAPHVQNQLHLRSCCCSEGHISSLCVTRGNGALQRGFVSVMLLRCLQANGSFEEEWAALSGQHLQTGLRQGEQPRRAGRPSVKWSCGNMENSNYSICVEDNTLSTEIPCCSSMFAKTYLTWKFRVIGLS